MTTLKKFMIIVTALHMLAWLPVCLVLDQLTAWLIAGVLEIMAAVVLTWYLEVKKHLVLSFD